MSSVAVINDSCTLSSGFIRNLIISGTKQKTVVDGFCGVGCVYVVFCEKASTTIQEPDFWIHVATWDLPV